MSRVERMKMQRQEVKKTLTSRIREAGLGAHSIHRDQHLAAWALELSLTAT